RGEYHRCREQRVKQKDNSGEQRRVFGKLAEVPRCRLKLRGTLLEERREFVAQHYDGSGTDALAKGCLDTQKVVVKQRCADYRVACFLQNCYWILAEVQVAVEGELAAVGGDNLDRGQFGTQLPDE